MLIIKKRIKFMKNFVILLLAVLAISCSGAADKPANVEAAPATMVIYGDTIVLTQPNLAAGKTINEALAERASSREYSAEPLSLEELSSVLWAAAGVNRPNGHLTAPSAWLSIPLRSMRLRLRVCSVTTRSCTCWCARLREIIVS